MHQETEESKRADETGCPECGSARVRYRVQHSGVSHRPLQERSLLWECRQCAAHWSEPLFAVPAVLPSLLPSLSPSMSPSMPRLTPREA